MKKILTMAGLTCLLWAPAAQATTITFDDVASGTQINAQYSALGVTLGCFNGNDASSNLCSGNVYANSSPSAQSASNVISFTSGTPLGVFADERFGYFKAVFDTDQSSVSIDALNVNPPEYLGTTTNRPFLQAFDSGGHFLAEADWTGNTDIEAYQTLTVNSLAGNIAYVAFSSFHAASGHAVYGEFDNLTFSGTTGGGGTAVPEPGTLVLLVAGLLGCCFASRAGNVARA
jgi:hypothetical protein